MLFAGIASNYATVSIPLEADMRTLQYGWPYVMQVERSKRSVRVAVDRVS